MQGSYELSHIWIPLEMEPSYGLGFREAFICLNELDPLHKRGKGVSLKITLSKVLGKIASLIAEASKPYDLYLWNLQLFYS